MEQEQKGMSMGTAATILAVASVASYAMGLVRDRIFAHVFGASPALDAYYAAFTIPDLIFNLFTAGIVSHAVFIPVLSQYYHRGERDEAWKLASSFINIITVIITCVAVTAWIFMPRLFSLVAPGFVGSQHDLGVNLTRILLMQPILFGLSNTFGAILVSLKRFSAYAFAPAIYNLGILITTLLFYKQLGIYAAMVGVVVGVVFHLGVRIWDLRKTPFRYQWVWNINEPGFKRMLKLAIPKTLGLVAGQANLYAYTVMGSLMTAGTIAVFNFARNLQSFPVSLIGIAMATASLPTLAAHAHREEQQAYTDAIDRGTRYILFLALPATAGLLLLGHEVVIMILHSGAFDPAAAARTAGVLAFLTVAIIFESMKYLLATAFYARQDTLTPILVAVFAMVVNITLSWMLHTRIGVAAFGAGFLAGEVIQVIAMEWRLRPYLAKTSRTTFISLVKIAVATGIMAAVVVGSKVVTAGMSASIVGVVGLASGIGVYLLTAWFLRMPELSVVPAILKKLMRRS